MPSSRSIKSDPLGVVDTRLTDSHLFPSSFTSAADTRVTSDSQDLFASNLVPPTVRTPVTTDSPLNLFSPSFATFTAFGLDGPADMTTKQTSLNKERGFKELQEASLSLRSGQSFPRLVLDAATDKYVLDNIGDTSNPPQPFKSNSKKDCIEEPALPHATPQPPENLHLRDPPNTDEFNYDCFQDSPEADLPKGRFIFHGHDRSQSSTPPKDQQNPLKPPIAALANHYPAPNVTSLKRSGNRIPAPRSVRFSPAIPQIPPSPAQRPLSSVDHLASSRQKQPSEWNGIRRATPHRVSPSHNLMNKASAQTSQIRDHAGIPSPSPSSLPNAAHVEYSRNKAGTPIANQPKGVGKTKKKVPRAMAFLFGIYRPRKPPADSPREDLKYVVVAIASQASQSEGKMPRFAPKFEQIAFHPPMDEVLCQFCIIIPAILITMPVGHTFHALQYLGKTRIGAAIMYFIKILFSTFVSVIIRAFSKYGLRLVTRAGVEFLPKNSS
ncbi:hypothetical protein PENANT_c053G07387 [Penicillium antarcticum]|uniref:Uncharacterized protein n=1 Tax=Penicillium antarcticum TaxID=416450 RepID=A0A1V6PQP9_9EURO|nr:hypothetical protein PENANT_c053G07387 [Penicillium antarcticum]